MVDDVTAHVTECTGPKVPPTAPANRSIDWVVCSFTDRSKPQVPIECCGDGRSISRATNSLFPEFAGAIGPDVNLPHVANDAGLNPFSRQAGAFRGMALIAHGGHDLCRERGLGQLAAFVQRVC